MSWLYSRALVAAFSADTCSDGAPSAPSSTMLTPQAYLCRDKTTDAWRRFPSGMTCGHLTDGHGEELLMSFREAFRVKTLAQQEREQESTENEAGSGEKWLELSVKYDRDSHSWKTHRCSFQEDLQQSSVTLPKWGMIRRGVLFRLRTAEHPTFANASGLSLGTPTASMRVRSDSFQEGQLPTPDANCGKRGTSKNPSAKTRPSGAQKQLSLNDAVKMYSTPTARDWKDNGKSPAELARNSETLACQAGGKLNPPWVEWLMGWPIGWTDLKPLEMDKFQQWRRSHGEF
jgi:hypothetical protein